MSAEHVDERVSHDSSSNHLQRRNREGGKLFVGTLQSVGGEVAVRKNDDNRVGPANEIHL